MEQTMKISSSPHIRDKETTGNLMAQVVIALLPATIFGIWNFGMEALAVIMITVASCLLFEFSYEKLMNKDITIGDGSAFLTGLLLALNLPPSVPLWLPILGSFFGIVVVKQLFGGLGQNFMNPALAAKCFLAISFTGYMTHFTYDGVAAAPLVTEGNASDLISMLIGTTAGTIGGTSVIALMIGGLYLIAKKVISYKIPFYYIFSFFLFMLIYTIFIEKWFDPAFLAAHVMGGGLILGAFFMATDYVTSPITAKGKILFGILLGFFTFLFRIYGSPMESVSYAIILGNLFVPLIEKVTGPKAFGKEGKKHVK